jgi:hypothetical protein
VAQAVPVRPVPAALGDEAAVENGFAQAGPFCFLITHLPQPIPLWYGP